MTEVSCDEKDRHRGFRLGRRRKGRKHSALLHFLRRNVFKILPGHFSVAVGIDDDEQHHDKQLSRNGEPTSALVRPSSLATSQDYIGIVGDAVTSTTSRQDPSDSEVHHIQSIAEAEEMNDRETTRTVLKEYNQMIDAMIRTDVFVGYMLIHRLDSLTSKESSSSEEEESSSFTLCSTT